MLRISFDTLFLTLSYEKITRDELGAKLDWPFPFHRLLSFKQLILKYYTFFTGA